MQFLIFESTRVISGSIKKQSVAAHASKILDNLKYFCARSTNSCKISYTTKKGTALLLQRGSLCLADQSLM